MTQQELISALESDLLPKIYGFCRMKLGGEAEAEDLAQEICVELLKAIRGGKEIENFSAFAWSVSNHLFYNHLRKKKRLSAEYASRTYLSELVASGENTEEDYLQKEQTALLRRELALMSGNYRKAVILHYFDGLSCEEIGNRLGKSAGTVKWWLHDAREAIKKGMEQMRTYGEKSYHPETLYMACTGMPGNDMEPISLRKRKSTQNLLLAAYQKPVTVTQLCEELGISAPYIEDELEELVRGELVKELPGGKYQTDFVILPNDRRIIGDKLMEKAIPAYYEKLISLLEAHKDTLSVGAYNTPGFSWERLLWVYIPWFAELHINRFRYEEGKSVKYADMPIRPNGGKWIAFGYHEDHSLGTPEKKMPYHQFQGPVHKIDGVFAQGFYHHWCGTDKGLWGGIFFETPGEVMALCNRLVKGELTADALCEEEKVLFARALELYLFLKMENGYLQNYYYASREVTEKLGDLAESIYPEVRPLLEEAFSVMEKELADYIPAHLDWQKGNFIAMHFGYFTTGCLYLAEKAGKLSSPAEYEKPWLSLFVSDEG